MKKKEIIRRKSGDREEEEEEEQPLKPDSVQKDDQQIVCWSADQ